MKIAVTGPQNRIEELKLKISSASVVEIKDTDLTNISNLDADALIDLDFDDNTHRMDGYLQSNIPVLVSAAKAQLAAVAAGKKSKGNIFGINALPTFINRPLLEVTSLDEGNKALLETLAEKLNWKATWVDDRVGMVTLRIVFMIINEAYYTVQEGTAGKADIDTGMKLGTNYPFGPFEWAEKIGIRQVYEVLNAIYEDTRDERYKICPLLKTEYLKSL